jgi:hypothetical protein
VRLARKAPPTAKQVAALQALMVHRTLAATASALGVSVSVIHRAATACAKRAANVPTGGQS